MNRSLFFLLTALLLIPGFSLGQLTGTYHEKNAFMYSWNLTFAPNRQFSSRYSHCTGVEVGDGSYEIVDNKLYLYYRTPEHDPRKGYTAKARPGTPEREGLLTYNFLVTDPEMDEPLPFTTLLFIDKEGRGTDGAYTDEDGKAKFSFPMGEVPDSVQINFTGSKKVHIALDSAQSQNWQIALFSSFGFPETIETGVHIYEYRPMIRSNFKIRQISPWEADDWVVFQKTDW